MRKLFISFVTAVLLASCSADSLMKETELDLTDTEKVYSDITLTRKVAYDLYARMRMGRDRLGSFVFLANMVVHLVCLTTQQTMEPEIQPVPEGQLFPNSRNLSKGELMLPKV